MTASQLSALSATLCIECKMSFIHSELREYTIRLTRVWFFNVSLNSLTDTYFPKINVQLYSAIHTCKMAHNNTC